MQALKATPLHTTSVDPVEQAICTFLAQIKGTTSTGAVPRALLTAATALSSAVPAPVLSLNTTATRPPIDELRRSLGTLGGASQVARVAQMLRTLAAQLSPEIPRTFNLHIVGRGDTQRSILEGKHYRRPASTVLGDLESPASSFPLRDLSRDGAVAVFFRFVGSSQVHCLSFEHEESASSMRDGKGSTLGGSVLAAAFGFGDRISYGKHDPDSEHPLAQVALDNDELPMSQVPEAIITIGQPFLDGRYGAGAVEQFIVVPRNPLPNTCSVAPSHSEPTTSLGITFPHLVPPLNYGAIG